MKRKRIIQILIAVVVIGLLIIAYSVFFLGDEQPRTSSSARVEREVFDSSSSSLNRTEAQELLRTLKSLEDLNLDPRLFSSEAFQSLIDFSRTIPKRQVGRDNPFAPINLNERQSTTTPSNEGGES